MALIKIPSLFCDEKEIKNRYDICMKCSEFIKNKKKCKVCGCNMEIKSKFRFFNHSYLLRYILNPLGILY